MKDFKLPYITIAAGALFQLVFLYSHDILSLLLNTIPDDAFYYFQPARNIVNGLSSTLDGVNLTNGYHPLWMFVLVPIFKFFSVGGVSDTAPIYAALTAAIFLSLLTSIILYRILLRFTQNQKVVSFVLFVYLFNPNLLYNVLNGLETSLVLFLLSLFTLSLLKTQENLTTGRLVFLGIIGGLLSLARLDMVVVVAFGNLFLLYHYGRFSLRKAINYFFVSSITSAIIFISWAVYNFKTFGIYLTSASVTSTFVNHRLTYSDNGGESLLVFIKTVPYMLERAMQQIISDTGAPIMLLMVLGVAVYLFCKQYAHMGVKNIKELNLTPVFFVAIGLLVLMFISAGLRWTFRGWYFIPFLIPLSVIWVWVLQKIWLEFQLDFKKIYIQYVFLGVITTGVAYAYFIAWNKDLKDRQVLQSQMYEATLWQNNNLPEGSHIGVYNSGIQAYFSKHKVTNLDGLINNNASKAMLKGTLWNYITEIEHINYISDFDSYMTYRYKDSFGIPIEEMYSHFEKVQTFPGPKDLNVYKIKY